MTEKVKEKLQIFGFWILIIFMLGVLSGSYLSFTIQKYQLSATVKLGGMIVDDKIYEVRIKP